MGTRNSNNTPGSHPDTTQTPVPVDVHLQTFHHLLYDSLMPWLSENDDPLRYRALLPDLMVQDPAFFKTLLRVFKKRNLVPTPSLKKEWELFASLSLQERAVNIHDSLIIVKVNDPKILFYQLLMFQSLLHSESLLMNLMNEASETMKRFLANQWMKTTHDLVRRTHELFMAGQTSGNSTILFFTEIALHTLESEILYHYSPYCQPVSLTESLNNLSPDHPSLEENRSAVITLDKWFKTYYFPKFILKSENDYKTTHPESDSFKESAITTLLNKTSEPKNTNHENDIISFQSGTQETEIIGTREVRELLGIGKTKLLELCHDGEIPCFRMGRLFKFNRIEILEYRKTLYKNPNNN